MLLTGLTKVGTGEAPPALKPLKASGTNGETPGVTSGVPAEYPPMPPPPMPPIAFAPFSRDIDFALRFISSCASRSLDCSCESEGGNRVNGDGKAPSAGGARSKTLCQRQVDRRVGARAFVHLANHDGELLLMGVHLDVRLDIAQA